MEMAGIAYHIMVCFVAAVLNVPSAESAERADIQVSTPVRQQAGRLFRDEDAPEPVQKAQLCGTAGYLLAGALMMHLLRRFGAGSLLNRRRRIRSELLLLSSSRMRQPFELPEAAAEH